MAGTDNQITMETSDLQEGSQDTSGNHRLTLRKATSLSRLPTPAGGTLRSPPPTPQSPKSPTLSPLSPRAPPVLRSSLLTGPTLIPPPRTKRDSLGLRISPTKVRSHEGSPTSAGVATSPGFTYNSKKSPAPAPPPRTSPTRSSSSPVAQRPAPVVSERENGSAGPASPPVLQRASSPPISMSSARTTSSSSTASSTSPTAPRRPSRDRIRSHSPPSAPVVEKKAPVFQAPPAPSRPPPPPSYEVNSRVVKSEARLFVNPEVPGYVGFANLPNQVHRKSVKKGFEFTLMVVGESGLGKSTLVNSLFLTDLYPERQLADAADKIEKTVKIDASAVEIEERGVKLRLTVVDTPGFADALNNDNCFKTIISYIDDQFERYLHDESGLNRRHIVDNRVHCCFYFVNPAGHGLKPLDISFMKAVHHKVNIVPVIAKSDTLTRAEVLGLKKKIMKQVEAHGIVLYQLPDCDEDEDEDYKEQCHQLKSAVPFAVVGANQVIEIRGRKVRGRMYPWGVVEVENPEHCDFIKLRTMLITHMQDLQEVTQEIHYENFRSEKLAVSDGVMRKPKTPRTSRVESDKEAKLSEKEHALEEKENELKRMQEMLSRMQAEMKQQQQQHHQQPQHGRPRMEAPPPPANRPTHNANGSVNGHPQPAINNNTKPSQTA